MAECRERVGKGVVTYSCSVSIPAGESRHDGPCAAIENPRSMKERERWEAEQRHQASGLGEFQGRAQTTAERYTDGATEPPGQKDLGSAMVAPPGLPERIAEALDNPGVEISSPSARVFRGGTTGAALDEAGVPIHVAKEAPATPQGPTRELPEGAAARIEDNRAHPERLTRVNREHDQAMPTKNDRPAVQDEVLADIEQRKQIGLERYGTLLQPFNGRDALRDLYEEQIDALMYVRQLLDQDGEVADRLHHIRDLLDPPKVGMGTPSITDQVRDQVLDRLDDILELLGE